MNAYNTHILLGIAKKSVKVYQLRFIKYIIDIHTHICIYINLFSLSCYRFVCLKQLHYKSNVLPVGNKVC